MKQAAKHSELPRVHIHFDTSSPRKEDGHCKFSLRISFNGKPKLFKVDTNGDDELWMHPKFWVNEVVIDEKTGKPRTLRKKRIQHAKGNGDSDSLERKLKTKQSELTELLKTLRKRKQPITFPVVLRHWSLQQTETFSDWLAQWIPNHIKDRQLTKSTKENYEKILRHVRLFEELNGRVAVAEISPEWLRDFQTFIYEPREKNSKGIWTGQGLKGTSGNKNMGKLCYALSQAAKSREIEHDPTDVFKERWLIEADEPERPFLEAWEIDRMYEAFLNEELLTKVRTSTGKVSTVLGERYHQQLGMVLFGLFSGLRNSDLRAVAEGSKRVHIGKDRITVTMKKGKRKVRLYITDKMRKVANLTGVGPVWTAKMPNRSNLNVTVRRMMKYILADDRRMTVHSLRRSFATYMVNKGTRLELVSTLLGHKSIQTTHEHYAHINDTATEKAMTEVWDQIKETFQRPEVQVFVEDVFTVFQANPGIQIPKRLAEMMETMSHTYNLVELEKVGYEPIMPAEKMAVAA
ncbi:MAG: tyrosine-type recombinase/integrase [Bacteroidota bacterium]